MGERGTLRLRKGIPRERKQAGEAGQRRLHQDAAIKHHG